MAFAFLKSYDRTSLRVIFILLLGTILSLGIYLIASAVLLRIGFPLDDSWIHLTYARNIVQYGEWAFIPGQPSAGSTAPLWSMLLSIGFLFHLGPYLWTFFLGGLILFLFALFVEFWARKNLESYHPKFPVIGLFFTVEWHLVWSAGSGMETILYAFLVTVVLIKMTRSIEQPLALGMLCGLAVWLRPDGLTLLGPFLLTWIMRKYRPSSLLKFISGFGFFIGLYFFFNLVLSGNPFPNTFYAKQAEYISWQETPLLSKVGLSILQVLTGPSILLLPGMVIWSIRSIRVRDWGTLSGMIWFTVYIIIYSTRLPPYQHGRYLIPAMPIFFFWGLSGLVHYFQEHSSNRRYNLLKAGWVASLVLTTIGFMGLGARSYALDVAYIETEMVATAKWVKANLPSDALIAAHDIGAVGYFDDHNLIDLAGLVSPQVIPFLRDETQIAVYFNKSGVDYFIAFPGLYPELASRSDQVFTTDGWIAPYLGGENLTVYQWTRLDDK